MPNAAVTVELSAKEVRLLVQSLTHCLATCHQKEHTPEAPCEDCAAATSLRHKLEQQSSR